MKSRSLKTVLASGVLTGALAFSISAIAAEDATPNSWRVAMADTTQQSEASQKNLHAKCGADMKDEEESKGKKNFVRCGEEDEVQAKGSSHACGQASCA